MIIDVNTPSRNYKVLAERGGFSKLTDVLEQVADGCSLAVLTDDKVDSLYADRLAALLDEWKHPVIKYVIKNGEASKNPENLFSFLEFMAENGICRSDCIIALGGGVVGDMAGFAASIYQRGIKFIQIPTTLLAMVDSSVGGKTAVDLKAGKNLAGAFWQPEAVICDSDFTKTLDKNVFRDGCAEIIKYGVILDKALFERLEGGIESCLDYAISRSVELKRDVVGGDERDNGIRAILNYGHTFGHSIESLSNFEISHGSAVAKGMLIAAKVAKVLGISDICERLESILTLYGFDVTCPYTPREIAELAQRDKKRSGSDITLVLPLEIGKCRLYKADISSLEALLDKALSL